MRDAFFRTLLNLADQNPHIHLIVGDLGFGVVEPFIQRFPKRFINSGVAEQNMTGIAAGLALSGKLVFTYSIANFPTLRCLEQIRNDVCYHHANVKIVSVGGGFSYGSLGMTHHATEDLAIMRALPGMIVVAPGDPIETELATRAIANHTGPCYLRLGRAGEPVVHRRECTFEIGKAITLREGRDLTIISTGGMLGTAMEVCDHLERLDISTRILSMHTIKPLDKESILRAAAETQAIVSVEEHSLIGGLGGAVSEVLAESLGKNKVPFLRIALPSELSSQVGDQDYLRGYYGLSKEGILTSIKPIIDQIKPQ